MGCLSKVFEEKHGSDAGVVAQTWCHIDIDQPGAKLEHLLVTLCQLKHCANIATIRGFFDCDVSTQEISRWLDVFAAATKQTDLVESEDHISFTPRVLFGGEDCSNT